MKRIISVFLIVCMLFCTVGCSKEKSNSSGQVVGESGDKVVDFYVEYESENQRHLLLFGLTDADDTYFSSAGIVSITITDSSDNVLFQRSLSFGEHYFSEWINSSWDSPKLLCSIPIEDTYITGNAANSKTLSLQITLNDERFFDVGDIAITHPSADGDGSSKFSPFADEDGNGINDSEENQGPTYVDTGSQTIIPQAPTEPITFDQQMKNEAAACGAPYEKRGRALVWHDEFNGTEIDYNKWCFHRTMREEGHEFDNSKKHIRVENGNLHMQIHKSQKAGKTYSLPEGFTTTNTMLFKYGYLEMRAKIPFRKGAWPSFWCTSYTPLQEAKNRMEVDIFEGWSSSDTISANLHKWGDNWKHMAIPCGNGWPTSYSYTFKNPTNLNNEYHTYGFEWDPDYMHFYVDDVKFATFEISGVNATFGSDYFPETDMFHDWLRIIINNECFAPGDKYSTEKNVLTDSDEMPIDYYVDYVRLYQNSNAGETFKTKDEIAAIVAAKQK